MGGKLGFNCSRFVKMKKSRIALQTIWGAAINMTNSKSNRVISCFSRAGAESNIPLSALAHADVG